MDRLGIYLSFSLYFVVAAIFEFACVLLMKRYSEHMANDIKSKAKEEAISQFFNIGNNILNRAKVTDDQLVNQRLFLMTKRTRRIQCFDISPTKIDIAAFFVFLVGYMLFNIAYWCL